MGKQMNKNSDITTSYKNQISDVPKPNHILSDYFTHSTVLSGTVKVNRIRGHRAINGYGIS